MDDARAPAPWRPGVVAGSNDAGFDRPRLVIQAAVDNATLTELHQDYRFSSLGLIYERINLAGRDPLADFLAETGDASLPPVAAWPKPLFAGFSPHGEIDWNRSLLLLPPKRHDALRIWLTQLTISDPYQKIVYRVRDKTVYAPDVASPLPLFVPVTMFCLDTNVGCWHVESRPGTLPTVTKSPYVFPETRLMAESLFSDSLDLDSLSAQAAAEDEDDEQN